MTEEIEYEVEVHRDHYVRMKVRAASPQDAARSARRHIVGESEGISTTEEYFGDPTFDVSWKPGGFAFYDATLHEK